MLNEPTTIASAARLIAETLGKQYNQDYRPVFAAAGLDADRLDVAGARYPWARMQALWLECLNVTGDPDFGLVVGRNIRPTTFHALGFSWIASRTLLESLQRLCRYYKLLTNAPYSAELHDLSDHWFLEKKVSNQGNETADRVANDAVTVAIIQLCRQAATPHFVPVAVQLRREQPENAASYVEAFGAPVLFGQEKRGIVFDKATLEAPLPGDNLELAIANDRVAEDYIAALDPDRVATEVRKLLIELLPSGDARQEVIAQQMNRSLSTLQRQLTAEGTNYKQIREQTRAELAEQYVREGHYSLSQIAYLLGFSDQSNFSRAFRRWTGQSPKKYTRH